MRVEALVHAECNATGADGGSGRSRRGSGGGGGGGKNNNASTTATSSGAKKRSRPAGTYAVSRAVQRAAPRANPANKDIFGASEGASSAAAAARSTTGVREQRQGHRGVGLAEDLKRKHCSGLSLFTAGHEAGGGALFVRSASYSQSYAQGPSELLVELEGPPYHRRARMMVKLSHLYLEKCGTPSLPRKFSSASGLRPPHGRQICLPRAVLRCALSSAERAMEVAPFSVECPRPRASSACSHAKSKAAADGGGGGGGGEGGGGGAWDGGGDEAA